MPPGQPASMNPAPGGAENYYFSNAPTDSYAPPQSMPPPQRSYSYSSQKADAQAAYPGYPQAHQQPP
ncbi:MAG: hypothetical protein M1823_007975, partial [Watsoniomyces obsoletus]